MTGGILVRINDSKRKSPSEKEVGDLMEAFNGWGLEFFSTNLSQPKKKQENHLEEEGKEIESCNAPVPSSCR